MSLPLKIILPVAGGAVGLAVAIPLTTSSYSLGTVEKSEQGDTSIQSSDSTSPSQGSLPERSRAETSTQLNEAQESENQAKVEFKKCKEIVSKKDYGKLEMCLKTGNNSQVEFFFYRQTVIDSTPIKVNELKVTYSQLFLELETADEDGLKSKEFDLPETMYTGRSDLVFKNRTKNSMKFTKKDCSVEQSSSVQNNWRAICSLNPTY